MRATFRLFALLCVCLVGPLPALAQPAGIDPATLASTDLLSFDLGRGIGRTALDGMGGGGTWVSGYWGNGRAAPDGAQGSDFHSRGLTIGRDLPWFGLSPFIGYGQGINEMDDDRQEARIRSYFLGLGISGSRNAIDYGGAIFIGRSHNKISSPATGTGPSDHDGQILGLSLRGARLIWQNPTGRAGSGLDMRGQLDVIRHKTGTYDLLGPGGEMDSRNLTTTALRLEIGAPMVSTARHIRPFAAYTGYAGDGGELTYSLGGTESRFGAADVLPEHELALGLGFSMNDMSGMKGQVELSGDFDGHRRIGLNIGFGF